MTKSFIKSRTFWVNLVTLLVGIAACVAGSEIIVEYPQIIAVLAAVQGALNIVLRFITTQPIK